jgi:hypothetical protein
MTYPSAYSPAPDYAGPAPLVALVCGALLFFT